MAFAPAPGAFPDARLKSVDLKKGEGLYVHLEYSACGLGSCTAKMYLGSKQLHEKLLAKAVMSCPCCNCCRRCGCTCVCETMIDLENADGQKAGHLQLARDCSCLCCLPRLSVHLGGNMVGKVVTQCSACPSCFKEVAWPGNPPTLYRSTKCITNKVCSCVCPYYWLPFRTFCTNQTVVEYYERTHGEEGPAFAVANVSPTSKL